MTLKSPKRDYTNCRLEKSKCANFLNSSNISIYIYIYEKLFGSVVLKSLSIVDFYYLGVI